MSTIDLQVEGMSCGSCVKHVTQALQPLPGGPRGGGRSLFGPCAGERGTGAGQRFFVDSLDGCGLPREAGHRRVHSRGHLAAQNLGLTQRRSGGLRLLITPLH